MAYVTAGECNAWADKVKLNIATLDAELEASVATQVLARIGVAYDTTSWVDSPTTPSLVKKIIAMMYTGWYIQRVYSEDEDTNSYGLMLIGQAERLIEGIIAGTNTLPDVPNQPLNRDEPLYYPTDNSSIMVPTIDDPSLGPAKFSMGTIW